MRSWGQVKDERRLVLKQLSVYKMTGKKLEKTMLEIEVAKKETTTSPVKLERNRFRLETREGGEFLYKNVRELCFLLLAANYERRRDYEQVAKSYFI